MTTAAETDAKGRAGVGPTVDRLLAPDRLDRDAHAVLAAVAAAVAPAVLDSARGELLLALRAALRTQRRAVLTEVAVGLLVDARDGDEPSYQVGSFRDAGEWIHRALERDTVAQQFADPRPGPELADEFAIDVAERCRQVHTLFDGRIPDQWRTEERLAVALVLFDRAHLTAMDYTPQQATRSLADRLLTPPADLEAWLERIRAELIAEDLPVYPAPPTAAELTDMRQLLAHRPLGAAPDEQLRQLWRDNPWLVTLVRTAQREVDPEPRDELYARLREQDSRS